MANQQITQMELDFTGVESFSLIPVGVHAVKVTNAEFTKASTGSTQLMLNFEDANGATRKMWCSCVPAALWKMKQVLEALGMNGLDGVVRVNTKTLIGRACQVTVENDPSDESKQVISRVSKLGMAAPMEASVAANPLLAASVPPQEAAPMNPPTASMVMETPSMTTSSPSEDSVKKEEPAAPQGILPPWMKSAQAGGNTSHGNLPPWMRQQ